MLFVSVPGIDAQSYTRYVPLPWDRVIGNIEGAHARLPGRVQINVPIPDDATFTADQAIAFWEAAKGIPIASITHCHNRGGFLNNVELTGRFGSGSSESHFCGILARATTSSPGTGGCCPVVTTCTPRMCWGTWPTSRSWILPEPRRRSWRRDRVTAFAGPAMIASGSSRQR